MHKFVEQNVEIHKYHILAVICPSEEFEADEELDIRTVLEGAVRSIDCFAPDTVGHLQLRHVSEEDFLKTGTLTIPTKKKPFKTEFKNLKKLFPVLNRHTVPRVEAYGSCFCWKIYGDTKFRGEVQIVSEGDEIDVDINVGSVQKVLCSDLDDNDDY